MAREQDADGSAPGFPVVDGSELRAALSTFSSLRGLSTRLKGGDKARQARQQQLVEKASPGPCHPATAARTVPCTASSILSESGITGNASEAAVRSSDNVSNPSSMQSPSAGPIRINVLPTRSPADALNFREGHANRSRPLKLLPALLNRQSSPAAAHRMRPGDESDAEAEGRRENERLGSMLSCESSKPPTPEPRPIAPADRENPQLKIDSAPAGSVNGTSSERTLSGSRRLSEEDRFQAGDHRTLRSLSEAPMLESEIGSNPGSPRTPGVPRRKSFKPLFSKAVRHSRMQSNHSTRSTTNQIFGAMSLLRLKMEIKQEERHEGEGASNNKLIGESIAQAASLQERDEPFVAEGDTGMPVADVHNYMLYCQMHRLTIILRPVADGAAKAFLGVFGITDPSLLDEEGYPILERTEHIPWSHLTDITSLVSNARGKTMATALKSSPYGPIKGTVPLLAQLSKVGAAHAELRSNLEAALIAAEKAQVAPDAASAIVVGKEGLTQAFTRLKTMEATASRMFDKIQADSNRAMVASDMRLQKLLLAYNKASMEVRDKRKVAEMYVDEFNNSQFLGECMARYGPLRRCIHYLVHERENEDGRATLFEEGKLPVFVLPPTSSPATSADPYEKWDYEKGTFVRCPNGLPPRSEALPVKLVSSRHFYISDKTGRIEERAEGAVLVPDYDGLSWADDCVFPESLFCLHDSVGNLTAAIVEHCYGDMKSVLEQSFIDNMGMVSNKDIEHIHEVRCLTDWRQSHGEEANNTVKTQEFLPGNYPCFDSDGKLHVLRNMEDVVRFYRKKWLAGCPLRLNPNWNVILDFEWLPIMPTESIVPLYDRELNEAVVIEKVKHQKCHEWDFPSLKAAYERIFGKDTVEGWRGLPRTKDGKKATELSVWRAYVKYRDEIKVIQLFFRIRSLLLFPPLYLHYRFVERFGTDPRYKKLFKAVSSARFILRGKQNQEILKLSQELKEQKRVFGEKHGSDSTEFISSIWDYMMLHELKNGFDTDERRHSDASPFMPGREYATEQDTVGLASGRSEDNLRYILKDVVQDVDAIKKSQNLARKSTTAASEEDTPAPQPVPMMVYKAVDNKYYTVGELHGHSFMKRLDKLLPVPAYNPWLASNPELSAYTQQAVARTLEVSLPQNQSSPSLQSVRRTSLARIGQRRRSKPGFGAVETPSSTVRKLSYGRTTAFQRSTLRLRQLRRSVDRDASGSPTSPQSTLTRALGFATAAFESSLLI